MIALNNKHLFIWKQGKVPVLPFYLSITDLPNCELIFSALLISNFCKKTMIDTIHFIVSSQGSLFSLDEVLILCSNSCKTGTPWVT